MLRATAALIRRWVVRRWAGTLFRRDLSQPIPRVTPSAPVSFACLSRVPTAEEAGQWLAVPGGHRFAQRLADGEVCVLATSGDRSGGRIVGFGWLGFGPWRLDDVGIAVRIGDAECVLYDLYAIPDVRGAHIGSAIVAALLEEAKRRAYQAVFCRVSAHNKASRRLFSRLGFERRVDLSCLRVLGRFGVYVVRVDETDHVAKRVLESTEWLGPSIRVGRTGEHGAIQVRTSGPTHHLVARVPMDLSDPKE